MQSLLLCASDPGSNIGLLVCLFFLVQSHLVCRMPFVSHLLIINSYLFCTCVSSGKDAADTSLCSDVWQQRLQQESLSVQRRQLWRPLLPWQQPLVGVSGSSDPALSTQRGLLSWCKYVHPASCVARPDVSEEGKLSGTQQKQNASHEIAKEWVQLAGKHASSEFSMQELTWHWKSNPLLLLLRSATLVTHL